MDKIKLQHYSCRNSFIVSCFHVLINDLVLICVRRRCCAIPFSNLRRFIFSWTVVIEHDLLHCFGQVKVCIIKDSKLRSIEQQSMQHGESNEKQNIGNPCTSVPVNVFPFSFFFLFFFKFELQRPFNSLSQEICSVSRCYS